MDMSRRTLVQLGATGAASVLLGLTTGEQALAEERAKPRFPGDPGPGRLYYGASSEQDVVAWERRMGQRLALHRTYHQARDTKQLIKVAKNDLANGRMPHVSIKVPGRWAGVAAGHHDAWLRGLAAGLARLSQPLFLTLHHEPENDARRKGSPKSFVAMQTHAIKLFARHAPKVTIAPILQGWSFSKYNRRASPERWYVPSAKVYGVDVYNPFCLTDPKWVSFADKLREIKRYAHGKPIVIGEYGCRNDPRNPERAEQWMREAFHYARRHDIVSMSYFNSGRNSPEGSWALAGGRSVVFERRLANAAVVRPGH
jgi:hypothetical protein